MLGFLIIFLLFMIALGKLTPEETMWLLIGHQILDKEIAREALKSDITMEDLARMKSAELRKCQWEVGEIEKRREFLKKVQGWKDPDAPPKESMWRPGTLSPLLANFTVTFS